MQKGGKLRARNLVLPFCCACASPPQTCAFTGFSQVWCEKPTKTKSSRLPAYHTMATDKSSPAEKQKLEPEPLACPCCNRVFALDVPCVRLVNCAHFLCELCADAHAGSGCPACYRDPAARPAKSLPIVVKGPAVPIVTAYAGEMTNEKQEVNDLSEECKAAGGFLDREAPAYKRIMSRTSTRCGPCARIYGAAGECAKCRCEQCGLDVCDLEAHLHEEHGHKVDLLYAFKDFTCLCGAHGQERMLWYCCACSVPVCAKCAFEGPHAAHSASICKLFDVHDMLAETLVSQEARLATGHRHYKSASDNLAGAIKNLKEQLYPTAVDAVNAAFDSMLEAITKRQQELLYNLQQQHSKKVALLRDWVTSMTGTAAQVDLGVHMGQMAVASGSAVCMAATSSQCDRLKELCPTAVPDLPASSLVLGFDADECVRLTECIRTKAGAVDDGLDVMLM